MGIIDKIKSAVGIKAQAKKSLLNPKKKVEKVKPKYLVKCVHKKFNKEFFFETDKTIPELQELWEKSPDEDLDIIEFVDNK